MAKKKILTIGFELCDEESEYSPFDNDISLLDWDIILLRPDIHDYIYRQQSTFKGNPCLSDNESFKLKSQSEHWRREIKSAIQHGKLVIVFLCDFNKLYIATGNKTTSGTGRNQKVTRIVDEYDNYKCIPVALNPINGKGKEMKLSNKNSEIILSYWNEFSDKSKFNVTLNIDTSIPLILTKSGDMEVGSLVRNEKNAGAIMFLPDMDFYEESFINDEDEWTENALTFSARLIKEIVKISKVVHSSSEITPPPEWTNATEFKLQKEKTINDELIKIEQKLSAIQLQKEELLDKIKGTSELRNLLFEKGKPLEKAIHLALKTIGFQVSNFDNGESEFDAVFISEEGRFIGEAEGKDNKPINIEKLRQIALNIHEDLKRDEVTEPAKSVLFGNPYRVLPLEDRDEPFSSKCISSAKASSTALVFTPDLFMVAKYLSDNHNKSFAKRCRNAILKTTGRVVFPALPKKNESIIIENAVE
ncbi:hypothetical protein [Klebsiella grimontii]|uniref:hypothetical protein n=1 Tax=Klebsiella grimontii TaxID=2058152 RepID=UPI002930D833|nr:hypothetical protein [Klebsiella grimontii]